MIYTLEDMIHRIEPDNAHDWLFKMPHPDGEYVFVINKETDELTISHKGDRMDYCNLDHAIIALQRVSQLLRMVQNAPK